MKILPTLSPTLADGCIVWTRPIDRVVIDMEGNRVEFPRQQSRLRVEAGPSLHLPSGRLGVCDPYFLTDWPAPLANGLVPGDYPTSVGVVTERDHECAVFLALWTSASTPVEFVSAPRTDEIRTQWRSRGVTAIGVDHGLACLSAWENFEALRGRADDQSWRDSLDTQTTAQKLCDVSIPGCPSNVITCWSGRGDGVYPVLWGLDRQGTRCCLVVDFEVIEIDIWARFRPPLVQRILPGW